MILPFSLALLTMVALAFVLMPLLRRRFPAPAGGGRDIAIYRDQLTELDREAKAGLIGVDAAKAARIEIERRILAVGATADEATSVEAPQRRFLPVVLALALPMAALGIYLGIGRPELPGQPLASRPPPVEVPNPAMEAARRGIQALRDRVTSNPNDAAAWLGLGRAQLSIGRVPEAVDSLRKAEALDRDNADVGMALGEALVFEADGTVTPAARALFERTLARDPKVAGARYYLGLADMQSGDARAALKRWLDLEAESPDDAPWRATLSGEIDRVARTAGIDPKAIRPDRKPPPVADPSMPRPGPDDIARMQDLSPTDRDLAIRGMVDRLDARLKDAPDDIEGWRRLARARSVLGEHAAAAAAFARIDQLKPDEPETLAAWAEAALRATPAGGKVGEDAVRVLTRLEKLRPDNALALFYLAQIDEERGDRAAALGRLRRLRDMIPPEQPARAALDKRIQALEAAK